jgi:hypothetical protein
MTQYFKFQRNPLITNLYVNYLYSQFFPSKYFIYYIGFKGVLFFLTQIFLYEWFHHQLIHYLMLALAIKFYNHSIILNL